VNIAGELFAARGFSGTSLNDVAAAVGVLKGSLYHYISSKEDLLFDVIRVSHQGLREVTDLADPFASAPMRHLAAFSYGHVFLNAVDERIHRGIVFLQDSENLNPKKHALVMRDRDNYDQYLRNIIARGQGARQFDAELEPRMCSFAIFGVLTSYIRWYKPGGEITPHVLGRESAAFILAAVVSEQTRQKMGSRFAIIDGVIAELQTTREPAARAV
jgi:TetR/AcrR family transcriptional regulator, cholesterol catabolism regulator